MSPRTDDLCADGALPADPRELEALLADWRWRGELARRLDFDPERADDARQTAWLDAASLGRLERASRGLRVVARCHVVRRCRNEFLDSAAAEELGVPLDSRYLHGRRLPFVMPERPPVEDGQRSEGSLPAGIAALDEDVWGPPPESTVNVQRDFDRKMKALTTAADEDDLVFFFELFRAGTPIAQQTVPASALRTGSKWRLRRPFSLKSTRPYMDYDAMLDKHGGPLSDPGDDASPEAYDRYEEFVAARINARSMRAAAAS